MSGAAGATETTGAATTVGWTELWPEGAASPEWSHSGAAVLSDGRFLFAEPGGQALIALDETTGEATRVETPTQVGHGLTVSSVEGREIVWIADPGDDSGGRILRFDWTTGSVAAMPDPLTLDGGLADDDPRLALPFRPTSTAVVETPGPHFGELWVADGYGRSLVHRFGVDGSVLTIDGPDTGVAFDCPHGIAVDTRAQEPRIVVADRLHSRLVFLDLEGRAVGVVTDETVAGSAAMRRPSSLAQRGSRILVTDLVGALLSVSPEGRIAEVLPSSVDDERPGWPNALDASGATVRPPLVEGHLNSPHGIAVGPAGQVYLTEWLLGGRQLRLDLEPPA
ncbi:hypothetical protein [Frondihabitans australicus]|uniref:hypothetical protein n=1 Tax=Frondihabitans australicus TaxID=386892 RepID=UPI0011C4AA46|nr:hypothetical protein [Frondihabitans australicus]